MKPVTDPSLIAELERTGTMKQVTDPRVLEGLNAPPKPLGDLQKSAIPDGPGAFQDGQYDALEQVLKQSALPMIGEGAGLVAGTALGGPAGARIGEGVGAGAGEWLNQKLGITEEDPKQIGIAAAAPSGFRAATGLLKKGASSLIKRMPGSSAELNVMGIEKARTLPDIIDTNMTGYTWQDAEKALGQKHKIPAVDLDFSSRDLMKEATKVGPAWQDQELIGRLGDLQDVFNKHGSWNIPIDELRAYQKKIGDLVGQTRKAGGEEHGAYKRLMSSVFDAYDNAVKSGGAGGAAAESVRTAVNASKKEFAKAELKRIVEQSISEGRKDALPSLNKGRILDELRVGKGKYADLIERALDPYELADIKAAIAGINAPVLPPQPGAPVGSSQRWIQRGVGGLVGGAVGGIMGAGTGALAGPLVADGLAELMMTQKGRDAVRWASKQGFDMNHETIAMLGQMVASGAREPAPKKQSKLPGGDGGINDPYAELQGVLGGR